MKSFNEWNKKNAGVYYYIEPYMKYCWESCAEEYKAKIKEALELLEIYDEHFPSRDEALVILKELVKE
jgi:hypothetical protein